MRRLRGTSPGFPIPLVLRHSSRIIGLAVILGLANGYLRAEDKEAKSSGKLEKPGLLFALPLAITVGHDGSTNYLTLRGTHLTNLLAFHFTNDQSKAEVLLKAARKVDGVKEEEAKKIGTTEVKVELRFPSATRTPATNYFVVLNETGASEARPLLLLPAGALLSEKEPNGGFLQAQTIHSGQTIEGVIQEATDVDVFRLEGRAGQWMQAEVYAARAGGPLDGLLTLHDAHGHSLSVSDDVEGAADPRLRTKLPADGIYFLSLIDAHDKGGPTHAYLLSLTFSE